MSTLQTDASALFSRIETQLIDNWAADRRLNWPKMCSTLHRNLFFSFNDEQHRLQKALTTFCDDKEGICLQPRNTNDQHIMIMITYLSY